MRDLDEAPTLEWALAEIERYKITIKAYEQTINRLRAAAGCSQPYPDDALLHATAEKVVDLL